MKESEIKTEIESLVSFAEQLRNTLDEIGHEMRRCSDALERYGGNSPEYERRMRTLKENAKLNIAELKDAEERAKRLRDRLES